MTEHDLRQKVVGIAQGWLGYNERNGKYRTIIDTYNGHKPLAVGYKVKYTDAWCAAFASAAFIKAGLTDIGFTECSCPRMLQLYKAKGRWMEKDSYVPSPGDLVMYDWEDSGAGDNTGAPNHVGIVVSVSGGYVKVIEGNISNAVGYRNLKVDGKFIRGYCLPDYKSKATPAHKPEIPKVEPARSFDIAFSRTWTVTATALNMRRGAGTTKGIIKVLKAGAKVRCYGYYTKNGANIWLYVKDSAGQIGFVSKQYLR